MGLSKGVRSQILWKEETTFGTVASGNFNKMSLNSETMVENIDTIQADNIVADKSNPSLRGGNIACGGGITVDAGGARNLTWFKHLLSASAITTTTATVTAIANSQTLKRGDLRSNGAGDVYICLRGGTVNDASVATSLTGTTDKTITGTSSTTLLFRYICASASATSVKQHVITPGSAFPTGGLSVEKGVLGGVETPYFMFVGGRINSYEFTAQQSGISKSAWNLLFMSCANALSSGGGTAVNETAEVPFAGYDTAIFLNDSAQTLQSIRPHREFRLNISNNLDENAFVMGSRSRIDIPDGKRVISGTLGTYFQDDDDYTLFKNETTFALVVTTIAPDGSMVKWEFPEVKLTGQGTPQISGPGMLSADFNWTAFKNTGAEATMTVVNMNATNPS